MIENLTGNFTADRRIPPLVPPLICPVISPLIFGERVGERSRALAVAIPVAAMLLAFGAVPSSARPVAPSVRPYSDDSPWNLKIGPKPVYDTNSHAYIAGFRGPFGCDPRRYTFPLYRVDDSTAKRTVLVGGVFSDVTRPDFLERRHGEIAVPLPIGAAPAAGSDAQLILWNPATGDEWGFWKLGRDPRGRWVARNGYHYNTRWNGVPPLGFISRGAGVPYFAGLVQRAELARGRVEHAMALAVNNPAALSVFPATKSDGSRLDAGAIPEGARLQLDPSLTAADFDRWGLDPAGKILARAMQEYGMIVVDGGGHPKIMVEGEQTARWHGLIAADTVRPIPYSALRVLSLRAPERPAPPTALATAMSDRGLELSWKPSEDATRYRVLHRSTDRDVRQVRADDVTTTRFTVRPVPEAACLYSVVGINHNGVSLPSNEIVASSSGNG